MQQTPEKPHAFLYSNYTKQQGNTLPLCNHCSSQGLSEDQKKMQASQSGTGAFHSSFTRPQHHEKHGCLCVGVSKSTASRF